MRWRSAASVRPDANGRTRVSQYNDATWRELLDELRATHFSDLDGAEAALVLPVSDRLVARLVQRRIPAHAPIHSFDVRAVGDDEVAVHFRLKQPAFLPPLRIRLRVEQQPALPGSPVLTLRLLSQGLAAVAGPASRLFDLLPPGITLEGDHVVVRLDQLLPPDSARALFRHLTRLEFHVIPQRFVVTVRGVLDASAPPG